MLHDAYRYIVTLLKQVRCSHSYKPLPGGHLECEHCGYVYYAEY